jgi:hypothetical protein
MITALQHFISKKGKFVFILLLLLVVVSFVLYLSQGSSVFDLMSDGGRDKKEFFGYDWNDPDQRRFLSVTTRAAGAMGVISSPGREDIARAGTTYMEGLQQQMQAAFRANPEEVDRDAMQRMFEYMQAWPNFAPDFKAREIARSGSYGVEFLDSAIESRVALSFQADEWDFLSPQVNHPSVNAEFLNFLNRLDPSLQSEANRSSVFSRVGSRFGMSANELESVLYAAFRDNQIDRIYQSRGFALAGEINVLSHENAFAWDGDVAVLSATALPLKNLPFGQIKLSKLPNTGDSLSVSYGTKKYNFVFSNSASDTNGSTVKVVLGKTIAKSVKALISSLNQTDLGILASEKKGSVISLELENDKLGKSSPFIKSDAKSLEFTEMLSNKLLTHFEENRDLDVFAEEPRTFATAMVFENQSFIAPPPPADEARLRSYFERNRLDFLSNENLSAKGDGNNSVPQDVKFEDVAEQVRQKVAEQDSNDAKREASRLAQETALDFLDNLNSFADQIKRKFPDYPALRNSDELERFLTSSEAKQRKVSFSDSEMGMQSMVLGLERRASEQRTNREPLEEVSSLDEVRFFTRSVRKSRNGQVVFILDRKTNRRPAAYKDLPFSTLCREYLRHLQADAFAEKIERIKKRLTESNKAENKDLKVHQFSKKNSATAQAYFDTKQRNSRTKIQKLEQEKSELNEKESVKKASLDRQIKSLNSGIEELNQERSIVVSFLEGAGSLPVDGIWAEIERNENEVIFGKLRDIYSLRGKVTEADEAIAMQRNLELSRGMLSRDQILRELISSSFE